MGGLVCVTCRTEVLSQSLKGPALERKKGLEISKINCSYKDIKIKKTSSLNEHEIILENKDVMIDLGSIAKGFIADKIAEFLKKPWKLPAFY